MTRDEFIKEIEARGLRPSGYEGHWVSADGRINAGLYDEWVAVSNYLSSSVPANQFRQWSFTLPYSAITPELINAVAGEKK